MNRLFNPRRLIIVALGSNLGDSEQIIEAAFGRLQQFSDEPLLKSSLWETTPVDCPPGSPNFLNAVAGFVPRPEETPETLLRKLQALEREFGRQPKKVHNEARPLDLDIIAFARKVRIAPDLMIPHPLAHQRSFVLKPLHEIAPDLRLRGQKETVSALLAKLPIDLGVRKFRPKR